MSQLLAAPPFPLPPFVAPPLVLPPFAAPPLLPPPLLPPPVSPPPLLVPPALAVPPLLSLPPQASAMLPADNAKAVLTMMRFMYLSTLGYRAPSRGAHPRRALLLVRAEIGSILARRKMKVRAGVPVRKP